MKYRDFIFWITLPPGLEDLTLLREAAGLAEPLLDLRYGSANYRRAVLESAISYGLAGLTVFADCGNRDLISLLPETLPGESRIILASFERFSDDMTPLIKEFGRRDIVVGVEADNRAAAVGAVAAGADFIVASGNEASGAVSTKTSLVLIQELLEDSDIPLVIRGGLGPMGAAAAFAAGCSGCILDSQVLLVGASPLTNEMKKTLGNFSPSDTTIVGALVDHAYRLLCVGDREKYNSLAGLEKRLFLEGGDSPQKRTESFEEVLEPIMMKGFGGNASILPVGQGLAFAREFREKGMELGDVLDEYHRTLNDSVSRLKSRFPFSPGSSLMARQHGVRYPVVQGTMAFITDNPGLAVEVAKAGALPFVAAAGLSPEEIKKLLRETRSALGRRPFGVGIIGFSPLEDTGDQMDAVMAEPPDFIAIAGGEPGLARRFEEAGVGAYLHAPALTHIREFLDKGVKGIILEGHEAGGHVGNLGSLVLWELGVREIISRERDSTAATRLLLAGGIANAQGAMVAAVFASALHDLGVAVGLQIGTAYLMTREAVESGAITARYSGMLLEGKDVAVMGGTVNLPSQWLATSPLFQLVRTELELEQKGIPLEERKKRVERLNFDHMSAALQGRDGKTEGVEADDSSLPEAYLCGQNISVQHKSRGIAELHEELTTGAGELAESCPMPSVIREMSDDAVAIVGMGCIFPGANNPDEYWENIVNRVDMVREVPGDRWNPDLYYNPDRKIPDKTYSKIGAFVEGFRKDPLKFRIPPVSAPYIDRLQFLGLEAAHQALKDAGCLDKDFPKKRTAVFMGATAGGDLRSDYLLRAHWVRFAESLKSVEGFTGLEGELKDSILQQTEKIFKQDMPEFSEDTCGGTFTSLVAGRIAACFDLGGSGFVFDAACASSLAAIDAGVRGLREGRFDLVLAGATDVRVDAGTYVFFSSLGAISNRGSFPFDERADGFVLGEGAGMVLMKRLEHAVRDGDKIYAIIRSIGSSSDGRAKGITAPDVEGQIRSLENAYEKTPFGVETVSLVEAHGTGTWVGDITEIRSLTQFIRRYSEGKKFIGLGSVKSMVGHLKAAAGIAGVIKAALALHNRVLPPTINCEQPRKEVDWENSPLYLLTGPLPWKESNSPRRAAVESFGFGGINFHAVLEEAPDELACPARVESEEQGETRFPADILVFRGADQSEMIQLVGRTMERLAGPEGADLRRVALELQAKAPPTGPTLAVVATDREMLVSHLETALGVLKDYSRTEFTSAKGIYFSKTPLGPDDRVAFLFPGQGALYVNAGGDLPENFPFVREIFHAVDTGSIRHPESSILPAMIADPEIPEQERERLRELLIRPDYNHPAMLGLGASILEVLACANVRPQMVAGHSLGEYTALYAAGVFDMETAIEVTAGRGEGITEHCFRKGAMASVSASEEKISHILKEARGFVAVANRNCPAQTVISGDGDAIDDVMARLEKEGIPCQKLSVSSGYHTRLLEPVVEPFRGFLEKFPVNPPGMPVQSNLTGRAYEVDDGFEARLKDTLVKHLVRPVEFIGNIESMYREGARLFVEVGPGSTLCSFVDNILAERPHWAVPTNLPSRSATHQLLHALAFCAARGLPVDIQGIMPPVKRRRPLRWMSRQAAVKGLEAPLSSGAEVSVSAGLVGKALGDRDEKDVQRYLEQRRDFLNDFLRLDFNHFTGIPSTNKGDQQAAGDDLDSRVLELISRKTGYPPEVIDMDLDVEAELGIDSIKQVEILRELALEFDIDFGGDARSERYKISTLRSLVDRIRGILSETRDPGTTRSVGKEVETCIALEGWNTDCRRWAPERVETPLGGARNAGVLKGRRVALLAGEKGPGSLLQKRLEAAGAQVAVIAPSDSPGGFPPHFDLVLDLWAFTDEDISILDEPTQWWDRITRRTAAVLRVGQNLARSMRAGEEGNALWVEVTPLGGDLGSNAVPGGLGGAGIGLGLSRCLCAEFPDNLKGLYLDFDNQAPESMIADRVFEELIHERGSHEIGYSGGRRFEIRWVIDDSGGDGERQRLDSRGVVLAVGGARGITASICHELARRSGARFVIVGQSPILPDNGGRPESPITFESARNELLEESLEKGGSIIPSQMDRLAWDRVWEEERSRNMGLLDSLAGKVVYRRCDICNPEDVRRLVGDVWREYGRIDLGIHGGGMLVEKSIEDFDPHEFIGGVKTKALGTACLVSALSDLEVGAFMNLSSIAGRWGNMGQGAYAVGHEVASILVAAMRGKHPGRWINIFFGPWLNLGMTRTGAIMERLSAKGSTFITEKAGSEFFLKEFEDNPGHSVAFCGSEARGAFHTPVNSSSPAPLLDQVDVVGPGAAEARKLFDLKRDRFVADHYVGHEYPILPGVVSLEMMAQTASILTRPRFAVTGIEDISFPRAGKFPRGEPREFHVRARLLAEDKEGARFAGEVFSLFIPPGGGEPLEMTHAMCKIGFGRRESPRNPSLLLVSTGIGDCRVDASPLWETERRKRRLGLFQNIHSFSSVTRDGVVGEVLGKPVPEFGDRPMLDNPIRLDGLFDLVNLSAAMFHGDSSSFIRGVKSVEFFRSDDQEGPRTCRVRIREIKNTELLCDLEAMNGRGQVVERLSGVSKVMGDAIDTSELREPIWDSMRDNPVQTEIRGLLGYPGRFVLTHVPLSLVEGAMGVDEEKVLNEQLSEEEKGRYRSLKHPKRRLEWLAGRVAAKGAVRIFLDTDGLLPYVIQIEKDADNSPHVVVRGREAPSVLPYISISHKGDMAVAVASGDPGIGVDVEQVSESIVEIADEFTADEEVERVSGCSGFEKSVALTAVWAVKEACRKAVGPGSCSMKEFVIEEPVMKGRFVVCRVFQGPGVRMRSVVFRDGGYVYALSMAPNERRGTA